MEVDSWTAGTEPQSLAESGDSLPLTSHLLLFLSSSSLSSLQVAVVQARLSWGPLTAWINE